MSTTIICRLYTSYNVFSNVHQSVAYSNSLITPLPKKQRLWIIRIHNSQAYFYSSSNVNYIYIILNFKNKLATGLK